MSKKTRGILDVIRCDEKSYLVWKWHPENSQLGDNKRENAIRWGSSLRVKDGEVAVFVYNQKNGIYQDFIVGPYDAQIRTANLPILSNLIGLLYDGDTPFQAEIYFINLARVIQTPFGVPFFDVFDPRFLDFSVPVAVRGMLTFNIADFQGFIKLHRLIDFNFEDFQAQIKNAVIRYVKGIVTNIPVEKNIPVVQIERQIALINDVVGDELKLRLFTDFGVTVTGVDISTVELDKNSDGYSKLIQVTQDISVAKVEAQTAADVKNIHDMQRINAENVQETLRIQREEGQYAQHKQTQTNNFAAYQVESQTQVGVAGANALGQMGANNAGEMPAGGGGGFNPAAMMAGMAIGGAMGQNIAGTMNNMMAGVNQPPQTGAIPPPIPSSGYFVEVNGKQTGPFDMSVLAQMAMAGMILTSSLVWREGMSSWLQADSIAELKSVFGDTTPDVPPDTPQE